MGIKKKTSLYIELYSAITKRVLDNVHLIKI